MLFEQVIDLLYLYLHDKNLIKLKVACKWLGVFFVICKMHVTLYVYHNHILFVTLFNSKGKILKLIHVYYTVHILQYTRSSNREIAQNPSFWFEQWLLWSCGFLFLFLDGSLRTLAVEFYCRAGFFCWFWCLDKPDYLFNCWHMIFFIFFWLYCTFYPLTFF